jgi:nitrous oxide reductase accessory protein NosL
MRPAAVTAAAVVCLAACSPPAGPPAIVPGSPCAACGMDVRDLRFACERQVGTRWRVYDAIECLLRDGAAAAGGPAYLADYDRQVLHPADSLWVVRGEFASPMGGGFAAFLDRAAADSIAVATRGRVDRLAAFTGAAERAP